MLECVSWTCAFRFFFAAHERERRSGRAADYGKDSVG